MPASTKLQDQYGDALQVIFVECQGATREQYEAFAWKMKWMGNNSMWTEERPIPTVGNGLPETALIGVDGHVIMQGHPGDLGKKLDDAIAAEVKKSHEAPAGTPDALKKAWTTFLKGNVAAALAECDKVGTDEGKAAREEFLSIEKRRIARAKWLTDNGYMLESAKLTEDLAKEVKGCADLEPLATAETARVAAPEKAPERDAAKALASVINQIAKKKPFDPANVQKVEALAKKHPGTKTAERAAHIVDLSKVKAG